MFACANACEVNGGASVRSIVALFVVAGFGAVAAFGVVRLGGALEQLRALAARAEGSAVGAANAWGVNAVDSANAVGSESAPGSARVAGSEPSDLPAQPRGGAAPAPPEPAADRHITQRLVSDPEFMRAADELLRDPDPHTQREARELLRALGATVAEAPVDSGR
jgi:hypothetical protein